MNFHTIEEELNIDDLIARFEAIQAKAEKYGFKVSIRTMSEKMGLNYSTIYKWINKTRVPTQQNLKTFSDMLDIMEARIDILYAQIVEIEKRYKKEMAELGDIYGR